MITRTYIDRFNTIIQDSEVSVGISPVAILSYGGERYSRLLIHFSDEKLKGMHEDGVYPDLTKFKHILRIKNCGMVNPKSFFKPNIDFFEPLEKSAHASSFDLIFFEAPVDWDGGKGYDFTFNTRNSFKNSKLIYAGGANWFEPRTGTHWDGKKDEHENCYGVYSNEFLSSEYEKFLLGERSVIFAKQRFDVGDEDISVDITEVVNKWISGGGKNNGICVAVNPRLETEQYDYSRFISFFTHTTQNFYEPYVESSYNDWIMDDRANFILGKKNRLYLYSNIGGNLEDLDELPICTVGDFENEVIHQTKGVYYTEVMLPPHLFNPDTMLYDTWSNIKYDGVSLPDVELDFTTKSSDKYYNIGAMVKREPRYVPEIYGISHGEKIFRNGDIRKVNILARVPYTNNACEVIDNIEYRIYTHADNMQIEAIPYHKCERGFLENYFYLNMEEFVPAKYSVDIRISYNGEKITHTNILEFTVVNNI